MGYVGYEYGSSGAVTVDGVDPNGIGSRWSNNAELIVGQSGNGTLDVTNGGQVDYYLGGVIGYVKSNCTVPAPSTADKK